MKNPVSYLLFDVADTLLHKPLVLPAIAQVLTQHGYTMSPQEIRCAHRAAREALTFPPRTDKQFYMTFNRQFLAVLGVLPTERLVEEIYLACRGLAWEAFADVHRLRELDLPMGIVSNWDVTLPTYLQRHGLDFFSPLLCSEAVGIAKPDPDFYRLAAQQCGAPPEQIVYIGDSISLDIVPAAAAGMTPMLLDRYDLCPHFSGYRLASLGELSNVQAMLAP